MPPKSASIPTCRCGRPISAIPRKFIDCSNPTTSTRSHPSSSTSAAAAAATPTASTDSAERRPIHRSNAEHALQKSPHATAQTLQKTLIANSGLADLGNIDGNKSVESGLSMELQNPGIEQFGPEKALNVETVTVGESGDGSKNSCYISSVPAIGSHLEIGGSVKPITGLAGVAGPGNGKRRIVKKVVRVVKKVIKKRVLKRIVKHDSENQGLESEVVTNISNVHNDEIAKSNSVVDEVIAKPSILNEAKEIPIITDGVSENSDLVNYNVVEKSNLVDGVIEETSIINGVIDKENITDEMMQKSEHVTSVGESKPINGLKCKDARAVGSAEKELSEIDFSANAPELIVPANYESGVSNDVIRCVPASVEVEKVNSIAGNVIETEETADSVANNQAKDSVLEYQNTCIINKCEVLVGGTKGSTLGEKPESDHVEGENDCIQLNEDLILSDEMETLERKERQKTEIFVGGLDSNTKRDDIRKVFEEAGVVLDVRLIMSGNAIKNRGFAFVRFSTAADAKNALAKCANAEICGKKCNVAPVGGNDTIFLGNIDKNWKTEDVVTLLEKADIEKIDKVTLKVDPNNVAKNRGFAFIEFETSKYAQAAFNKLQNKDVFGKRPTVKVEWAQPLIEPDEEEILKVKCVYAEYLPSSWDEEMVKEYFKRFGEIEYVVLSKDLLSSRRKDFAFIHYKKHDAALRCIESISRERLEGHISKFKIAVSLANPSKQMKRTADQTTKQPPKPKPKPKPKPIRTSRKLHEPIHERKPISRSYNDVKVDNRPTTTDELIQILRQQASNKHIHQHPCPRTGTNAPDLHFPILGSKRPFSHVENHPLNAEPQRLTRAGVESSYPNLGPSSSSHGVDVLSVPYYYSQQRLGLATEQVTGRSYPYHFQEREQAPPHYRDNNIYRRY